MTGLVSRVERGAVHDGPGLRTVVFLKGCPLRCQWCHSPETQAAHPEMLLFRDRCLACGACVSSCPHGVASLDPDPCQVDRVRCRACGTCADICPTGARELSGHVRDVDDVMAEVLRDRMFFEGSGGGLTISGGEPLQQPAFTLALLARCRAEGIHTAVETCGLVNRKVLLAAAACTDLFLYDLKTVDEERHRQVTGVSNAPILANLATLAEAHRSVIVRLPLVPGVNDDLRDVATYGALVASLRLERVDVLPYHRAGTAKYARLDRQYPLEQLEPPTPDHVARVVETLRGYGLTVTAGGLA